jgi:type IV secretory pathway VirB4 component
MAEITQATQQLVEIKSIKNGTVYLKNGGLRRVLMVSGINFDLKSEEEQKLILSSFQGFLGALDFSAQIFIHSRKTNINAYLERLAERKKEEPNELLKIQIEEYINFVRSFIEENAIVSKTFFVIVPYDPIMVVKKVGGILSFLGGKKQSPQTIQASEDPAALEQLNRRVEQIVIGLEQIGLQAAPLDDDALMELYYNLYNPQLVEKKGLQITGSE